MTPQMLRAHERMLATLPVRTYTYMRDEPAPGIPPKKPRLPDAVRLRYKGTVYPSFKKLMRARHVSHRTIVYWIAKGEAKYV